MKKLLTIFLVGFLFLVGCSKATTNNMIIKQEYISVTDLENKINNKETFMATVASATCSHCNQFKNMLKSYESNGTVYLIEVTSLNNEDRNKLLKLYPTLNSVPTSFFYQQGTLSDTIIGYDEATMKTKLAGFFK